jgi:prepilin-type N-terminal cleavage/methylation domain-containing protein
MNLQKLKKTGGFTIIELIVVIFIFGVISSLVIFNYGAFKSDVSVENLAQDVALTIRRAQVYAVSTKGTDAIFPSYGIHFTVPGVVSLTGTERAFVLFADVPPPGPKVPTDREYTPSTNCDSTVGYGDECTEIIEITSSDKIVALCADGVCPTGGASLDIVFTRPNTEAEFCFKTSSTCSYPSYVTIKLQSINGTEKLVNVWNTGQINVQ